MKKVKPPAARQALPRSFPMAHDLLPRLFQADLYRFYGSVIVPVLTALQPHENAVEDGQFTSMDDFLDNAEKVTSNLVAYEARRCFALTLAAIFERQLQRWAHSHGIPGDGFHELLGAIAVALTLDLEAESVGQTLKELHLLGNAVRHGEGDSADKLRKFVPNLWPPLGEAPPLRLGEKAGRLRLSERIEVSNNHLLRYVRALTRFWGLADREPGALVEPPLFPLDAWPRPDFP